MSILAKRPETASRMSRKAFLCRVGAFGAAVALNPTATARMEEISPVKTLDLVERADLAINAITRCTNPENDYACWFYVSLHRNPPVAHRQIHLYGKFMEALALMRRMTSSDFNLNVDQVWHDVFIKMLEDRKPVLGGPEGGRQLVWLATKWEDTQDSRYRELGEQALQRGLDAAVRRDGYCYIGDPDAMPTGWAGTGSGWTVQGLAQFYDITGSERALELGSGLSRYLKDHAEVFDEDGHFLARHESSLGPALHFHHNCNALEGLMEFALATGDAELADFARRGYEYACSVSSPLVGFFPEYIDDWPDDRGFIDCEGCCVADMIQLALRISLAGVGDYWDDVDRYLRNEFAEMQMLTSDWVYRMAGEREPTPVGKDETGDLIPERNVGSFAGWALANAFYAGAQPGIMHCCTGNCARTLYHVWDRMLERTDDGLRLHLLLNHKSDAVDVQSEIPYHGRVTIQAKRAVGALEVRAPEWVESGSASFFGEVNGLKRDLDWRGRYARVSGVAKGDTVTFRFPISNRTVEDRIGGIDYSLVIRGNNVVSISPEGRFGPFYQYDLA